MFSLDRDLIPLGPAVGVARDTPPEVVLALAAAEAPYLARGLRRRPDVVEALKVAGAEAVLRACLSPLPELAPPAVGVELRRRKEALHLTLAAEDLSARMSQHAVTGHLSAFADFAVQAGLAAVTAEAGLPPGGLFVLALGKHGAGELNYSSDIDLVAFFDTDRWQLGEREPGRTATRLIQSLTQLLSDRTADGYVFRVDWRLRPDPNSTPVAQSTRFARGYYEAQGQTWERMAYIKARAIAGDVAEAGAFLEELNPFIWRRHLDYWALGDIHAIKRQIHTHHGHAGLSAPDFDAKLGRGGIREIEFFAQTQQLIHGGRPQGEALGLRARDTRSALAGLVELGAVSPETATALWTHYCTLRMIEHRAQVREDEQTHAVPADPTVRGSLARLAGFDTVAAFDALTQRLRSVVHAAYADLFEQEARDTPGLPEGGRIVLTGVEDDPETLTTLARLGFGAPPAVLARVRDWSRGHVRAARTDRGRQLLAQLTPRLLVALAGTGEPDVAFERWEAFLSELRAGAQALALFLAEPQVLAETLTTLVFAPRLARELARRPALIDALLSPGFFATVTAGVGEGLAAAARQPSLEEVMNTTRRAHREDMLRIGWQALNGHISPREAGHAYATLADATVQALLPGVAADVARRYAPSPAPFVVLGLGSFGGGDMNAASDLDLMLVYDAPDSDEAASVYFSRLMQRLTTALSMATEEGVLYPVDMQLRPSGNAGPAAVRLSSFRAYYDREAWTWELMALTRLRPVAGDVALGNTVSEIVTGVLTREGDDARIAADILAMRQKLAAHRPGHGLWDTKLTPGQLVDVEFLIQQALLLTRRADCLSPDLREALTRLTAAGVFAQAEAATLTTAIDVLGAVRQLLKLALETERFDPAAASEGLARRLAQATGTGSLAEAEERLRELALAVVTLRTALIGALPTDSAPLPR